MSTQQKLENTTSKATATAAHTIQSGRQKAAEYATASQQVVKGNLETLWDYSVYAVKMTYQYMDAMRPLKVGIYMCGALSALPLAIFITFLAITLAILVGTAGFLVTLLEGGAFVLGGTIVTPVLFCSSFVALFIVGGYALAYVTARLFAKTWGWVCVMLGRGAEEIEEGVQALEKGAKRGLHTGDPQEG
jgi:hypothetical protein